MSTFKIVLVALFSCLVLAALAGFGWVYSNLTSEVSNAKSQEFISIEKGTSPSNALDMLEREGVITSSTVAKIYLRLWGDPSKIQAGDYRFRSPISTIEVISELEKGKLRSVRITIPEGWTRFEISKRLSAKLDSKLDEPGILKLMDDTSLISDVDPQAKNLEGYLYPTTYEFDPDASPAEAVKRMVDQFKTTWKPQWTARAAQLGLTSRQVVTIASLIENETKVESERRIVSSVIHNRLKKGMALGIDATNVYIAKLLGRWDGVINKSDIEVNHPYNTRKIAGLPPGPISSASKSALEAALYPAESEYLFYVLNVDKTDGSHNFYASAAEFEKGKAKYQRWLAKQRQKK